MLNYWINCMLYPKIAYFPSKQTDLSSIHGDLVRNLKFLTDNRHNSRKCRVLICNTNTPLLLAGRQWDHREIIVVLFGKSCCNGLGSSSELFIKKPQLWGSHPEIFPQNTTQKRTSFIITNVDSYWLLVDKLRSCTTVGSSIIITLCVQQSLSLPVLNMWKSSFCTYQ